MLLQFSVTNYASIKNEVLFSLVPSKDNEHPENIIKNGKFSAVSLAAIYGANASGKSNLFKAMTNAIVYIRQSNMYQHGQKIPVIPYKFCENCASIPTKFEFTFVAEDGLKYIYGFSATADKVVEEYLYVFRSSRPSMLFDRTEEKYSFPRNEKANLLPLTKMNTPNKLFLATATSWNAQCTTIPFQWFATKIDTQTSVDNQEGPALEAYKNEKEKNIAFVRKLLKMADINIVDVDVEIEEMSDNQSPISGLNFGGLLINNQIIKPKNNRIEVRTGHIVTDETGIQKRYELSLLEESLGTIQLFLFAPFLRKALETGKVLFIDEIDRSLHPILIRLLVNLFRDNRINANSAQLIFNTHETALLSLGTFRRDQIYFTEKNTENGVTDLYSLDDLSVRKDENIEKGYLLGRYGAIPYLQTEDIVGVIRTHGKIATVFPDTDQSSVLKGRKK